MYRITFIHIETGKREVYMNNTAFTKASANHEIKLLKESQDRYEKLGWGRSRKYFKKEKIKVKKMKTIVNIVLAFSIGCIIFYFVRNIYPEETFLTQLLMSAITLGVFILSVCIGVWFAKMKRK